MKKILISPIIFLGLFCHAQSIDQIVKSTAISTSDSVSKRQITELKKQLDTVLITQVITTNSTPLIVDTLFALDNKTYTITLETKNLSNGEAGCAMKYVQIRNTNLSFKIVRDLNLAAYSGETSVGATKISWSIVMQNGLPVIRIIGASNIKIQWTIKREL